MPHEAFRILFALGGRMSRKRYVIASLAIFLVTTVLVMVFSIGFVMSIMSGNAASAAGLGLVSMLAIAVVVLAYVYSSVVMSLKRLSDMGQTGWHIVWILGAGLLAGSGSDGLSDAASIFGAICLLIWAGGSLWLLCAPGEPFENGAGPVPR